MPISGTARLLAIAALAVSATALSVPAAAAPAPPRASKLGSAIGRCAPTVGGGLSGCFHSRAGKSFLLGTPAVTSGIGTGQLPPVVIDISPKQGSTIDPNGGTTHP